MLRFKSVKNDAPGDEASKKGEQAKARSLNLLSLMMRSINSDIDEAVRELNSFKAIEDAKANEYKRAVEASDEAKEDSLLTQLNRASSAVREIRHLSNQLKKIKGK